MSKLPYPTVMICVSFAFCPFHEGQKNEKLKGQAHAFNDNENG